MSDIKKILISDRLSQSAVIILQHQKNISLNYTATPEIKAADLTGVHGLVIRSRTAISAAVIEAAKDLQVVVTCTSGFDHIDLEACARRGVTVMHSPDSAVSTVAQLTWSLLLACVHQLTQAQQHVKSGLWSKEGLESFTLNRKTLGLVGLGRIGKKVAQIAKSFDLEVIAFDPYLEPEEFLGAERVSYEELLKRADVVSFHVPLTAETEKMLNRSHFEYIRRGVILLNTSRGPVIDEQSLCEALEKNWIRACGFDVFEKEPLSRQSHLLKYPNVQMTPHIGARSKECFQASSEDSAQKIIAFFRQGSTSDTLPPKAAWAHLRS